MAGGWAVVIGTSLLAGCGRIGFDPVGDAQPTRQTLTLDRTTIAGPLADFPLLVVLDDERAARDRLREDASDLRFRDASGTLIVHELEQVGAPGGEPLVAWVRVPEVVTGTVLTLEYGDAPPPRATGSVWSASYAAVWHMGGDLAVPDATANGRNGVAVGTRVVSGTIGPARLLDAEVHDHVIVPSGASIALTTTTIAGWVQIARVSPSATGYSMIATRQIGETAGDDFLLGVDGDQPAVALTSDVATDEFKGSILAPDRWMHIALTWDLADLRLYIDGVAVDGRPITGTRVTSSARPIFLGGGRNNDTVIVPIDTPDVDFVDGMLDEIRIEHTARSPAWIAADVASMADRLIRYSSP